METIDPTPGDLPDRVATKVAVDAESGCWMWTSAVTRGGHGRVRWNGRVALAARLTYHLLVDPAVPVYPGWGGERLRHLCRVERCVNPAHLELVTDLGRVAEKIVVDPSGCWLWGGSKSCDGYGHIKWQGRMVPAHRLTYHLLADQTLPLWPGRGGDALTIDHLCRIRSCVNPDHLEPVTNRENALRGLTSVLGDHTSPFVGVSWHAQIQKWQTHIRADGRNRNLGVFVDEVDAAHAYDDAAEIYYGERTNERLGLINGQSKVFGQLRLFEVGQP